MKRIRTVQKGRARALAAGWLAARTLATRALAAGWLAGALAVAALPAATMWAAAPREPPIELVESVPVETALGNPRLERTLKVWLRMIRGARHTLDLEQFYLSNWPGEPLEPVLRSIAEAGARGVRVRLLLDRRMHATYSEPADSLGRLPGIETRLIDFGALAGGIQHAKFMIADGENVFLGSQNFDWRALKHIHEVGVRVRDERLARVFGAVFEADWALSAAESPGAGGGGGGAGAAPAAGPRAAAVARAALSGASRVAGVPFTVVQTPGDTVRLWPGYNPRGWIPDSTLWDRDAVVRLLERARSEIVVQVLTYSTSDRRMRDDALDRALRRAAARGVRVRLMCSDWETEGDAMQDLQALSATSGIEVRLSTVAEWSEGYVPFARVEHCKYAVVDSALTWVGTSNWEPGYFHTSRNLAVILENRALALEARAIFEASWRAATASKVTPASRSTPRLHGETPPPGHVKYGG